MNGKNRGLSLLSLALLAGFGALVARSSLRKNSGEHNSGASVPYGTGTRIEKAFTINRPADELYTIWRDLENLPSILSHVERIELIDERRSLWYARGPKGFSASWEAEIIDDTPGHRIAWRSTSGNIPNAGSVLFTGAPGERGTELRVEMEWEPPAGPLGRTFAHLFAGGDPGLIVESDLRRFKSRMEADLVFINGTDVKA